MNKNKFSIKNNCKYKYTIKKSEFISHSFKINSKKDTVKHIENINEKFNDANHNCWAYIHGINKIKEKYSDDGEPSGTAGKPILNILKQNNVTNTLIIVTRYFGGIKLGAGGLIRAYSKAAKKVLNKSNLKKILKNHLYKIEVSYDSFGKLENYLKQNNILIKDKTFKEKVYLNILIPDSDLTQFLEYYKNLVRNQFKPKYIKTVYI